VRGRARGCAPTATNHRDLRRAMADKDFQENALSMRPRQQRNRVAHQRHRIDVERAVVGKRQEAKGEILSSGSAAPSSCAISGPALKSSTRW
jgi:hypothetical protein